MDRLRLEIENADLADVTKQATREELEAARERQDDLVALARWTEPDRRRQPLTVYARDAETRALMLLEASLNGTSAAPNEIVRRRLFDSASSDIDELRPQLEPRAEEFAAAAKRRLAERGEREARDLRAVLERQRERVVAEIERHEAEFRQLTLGFSDAETRQLQADFGHWKNRLEQFDRDIEAEPERIRAFYEVRAQRVEPVGLVYLWPETN